MKKILLLTYFSVSILLFTNPLFGQETFNLNDYNWAYSEAQSHFANKNYKAANEAFKEVFKQIEFPFATDLELALTSAYKVKDQKWSHKLAKHAAKSGVPLSYFKKFSDFDWYAQFKSDFPIYEKYFQDNFDIEYREKISSLVIYDSINNAISHQFRRGEKEVSYEYLVYKSKRIEKLYKELYDAKGYASEKRIGYFVDEGRISHLKIVVLLRHIYQSGSIIIREDLDYLVLQGEMKYMTVDDFKNLKPWAVGIVNQEKLWYLKWIGQYQNQDLDDSSIKINMEVKE